MISFWRFHIRLLTVPTESMVFGIVMQTQKDSYYENMFNERTFECICINIYMVYGGLHLGFVTEEIDK